MDRVDLLGNTGSGWKMKPTRTEAVVTGMVRRQREPETWGGGDQSDKEGEGACGPTWDSVEEQESK